MDRMWEEECEKTLLIIQKLLTWSHPEKWKLSNQACIAKHVICTKTYISGLPQLHVICQEMAWGPTHIWLLWERCLGHCCRWSADWAPSLFGDPMAGKPGLHQCVRCEIRCRKAEKRVLWITEGSVAGQEIRRYGELKAGDRKEPRSLNLFFCQSLSWFYLDWILVLVPFSLTLCMTLNTYYSFLRKVSELEDLFDLRLPPSLTVYLVLSKLLLYLNISFFIHKVNAQ